MELFHVIDDGVVHLRSKGLYRQAKLYRRGRHVFAGYSGGFIRLIGHHGTTRPDVSWDDLAAPGVGLGNSGEPYWTAAVAAQAA